MDCSAANPLRADLERSSPLLTDLEIEWPGRIYDAHGTEYPGPHTLRVVTPLSMGYAVLPANQPYDLDNDTPTLDNFYLLDASDLVDQLVWPVNRYTPIMYYVQQHQAQQTETLIAWLDAFIAEGDNTPWQSHQQT